ncbi:MAG: hypothetical protein NVSMB32_06450 [Actinomycetota bacterium]
MILLCGIPTEPSLRRVSQELAQLGAPFVMLNQRWIADLAIECEVAGGDVGGTLTISGRRHPLEAFTGVMIRMMDDRELPEIRGVAEGSPLLRHSRELHDTLYRWCQIAPAAMLNRPDAMASNGSKPYQAQLIAAQGLSVPATLVTTDPEAVLALRARYGRLIYKSISGARSVVRELADEDLDRLDDIRWCPVQFQEYIPGEDVRVHVVGQAVFATAISSAATDYRYATRDNGDPAALRAIELDDELAQRCVALAASLGLGFVGIDLRITPLGRAVCFEVNPCPAFSYYESHTDQPIAAAVARYLAAGPVGAQGAPGNLQARGRAPGGPQELQPDE